MTHATAGDVQGVVPFRTGTPMERNWFVLVSRQELVSQLCLERATGEGEGALRCALRAAWRFPRRVCRSARIVLISLGVSGAAVPVEQMGKPRPGEANRLPKVLLGAMMAAESLQHRFFSSGSALPSSLQLSELRRWAASSSALSLG